MAYSNANDKISTNILYIKNVDFIRLRIPFIAIIFDEFTLEYGRFNDRHGSRFILYTHIFT